MKKFSFSDKEKIQSGIDTLSSFAAQIKNPAHSLIPPGRKLNKKRLIMFTGAVICFVAGLIYSVFLLFNAKPLKEQPVFELGEMLPTEASAYLEVGPVSGLIIKPDLSEVNSSRPGEYNVGIRYFGRDLSTTISITDTVSPEFVFKNETIYIPVGKEIVPADMIAYIKDADKDITLTFGDWPGGEETLVCNYPGEYRASITAIDSSGNLSRGIVAFVADKPPVLSVYDDIYIATGSGEELSDHISAYDETDGDLTDLIVFSDEKIDLSEAADYPLTISVTDSCRFTTSEDVTVHVMDAEDIQRLIGKGKISRENAIIIGAINVYDTGLISNQNFEDTLIDLMPTVVHIEVPESAGTYKTGSGYIAEITEDSIYIITNRHVIGSSKECDVYFYSGDSAKASVAGCADDYDVAVIKVPLSSMPENYENIISTVHIDMTFWDKIEDEDNISLGIEKMDRDGTIIHYTYGQLVNLHGNFEFFEPHDQTEISLRLRPGDSGSAVFDVRGRLICMAFGYSISPERDWGVPLDEIVKAYEQITGRELYTY